jgi:endogenous inhibitor of DNA gyrase (YacG/DUF329 family)
MTDLTCPICGRVLVGNWRDWPEFPFCSRRCRQIDLGRWLGEAYRIPAQPEPTDPDTNDSAPSSESVE